MSLKPTAAHTAQIAADLAATTALIEIGEQLGVSHFLQTTESFTAADFADVANVPEDAAKEYLEAMRAAALVISAGEQFRAADDFAEHRHTAGYLSWSLTANRPFIDFASDYLRDPVVAREKYQRDGRHVAVSSRWIGEQAFYPAVIDLITSRAPKRLVDLGAGAAGLLIHVLGQLPASTAVALDLSSGACAEATRAAGLAGLTDRLTVVERSIQSLVDDQSPLQGADFIHAGFVFHDMLPEEESTFDAVLAVCRSALAPGGILAITDSVPYASDDRERRFSAWFTYTHHLMGRQLLSEDQWVAKLADAGFSTVEHDRHRFPAGRLFVAGA